MNQRGFATIFGLCLVLVIALVVKGIEEAEMNHAYETTNYQATFDLQNAADSGIYEAWAIALKNPDEFLTKESQPIKTMNFGDITIETWGRRMGLSPYKVNYKKNPAALVDKDRLTFDDNGKPIYREAYVIFSRASVDSLNGKIYRRAFAYVFPDEPQTIHFVEVPTSSYEFK